MPLWTAVLIVVLFVGISIYGSVKVAQNSAVSGDMQITNFEECAAAGNAIMESYPEQCRTSDGRTFVRQIEQQPMPPSYEEPETPIVEQPGKPVSLGGCYVGGCSGQLCSDQKDMASTCEYTEAYACYKTATCERQPSGECGWTPSASLVACLGNAN